jgi:hypothetical protein
MIVKRLSCLLLSLGISGLAAASMQTPRQMGQQLKSIQVEELSFEGVTLEEVISVFNSIAREADPPVNMVLQNTAKKDKRITLHLRKVSLHQALITVSQLAQLRLEVRHGILFIE